MTYRAIKAERVIAERDGRGWLVMWPTGDVDRYTSKRAVLAAVKSRIGEDDILITTLEWRG